MLVKVKLMMYLGVTEHNNSLNGSLCFKATISLETTFL